MFDHFRRLIAIPVTLVAILASACAPAASTPTAAPAKQPVAQPADKPAAKPVAKALASDYFSGKTITLVVNFSAGGPTDIFGRMVAKFLDKHVPGNPTIIVQNMPGGGGKIGANYVYNAAKKDGTVIGTFSAPFANQIFAAEGVEYDAAKFNWLAGVSESSVHYAHKSLGIKTPQELSTAPNLIVGGFSPASSKDLSHRTFLNSLGVDYKYVTGYGGNSDARAAVLRGEINYFSESLTGWVASMTPLVNEGTAIPMVQTGIVKSGQVVRDPRIKDIPTQTEVTEELKGADVKETVEYRAMVALLKIQGAMLRAIVAPPGTDQAVVEALRKAVAATFEDKEFQAMAEKQLNFNLEMVPGPEAQALAKEIIDSSQGKGVQYLKQLAQENA